MKRSEESAIPSHVGINVPEIKSGLESKEIALTLHAISHGRSQDESLYKAYKAYKSYKLRTRESYWGSIDDGVIIKGLIKNIDDEVFFGLESKQEKSLMGQIKPSSIRWVGPESSKTGGQLFTKLDERFSDIRGVERSAAPIEGVYEGRIKTPIYDFPGLSKQENAVLSRITIIFGLNAHRDLFQAEYIAKILYKYTLSKDAASLGHIGGKNHVCLPYILKNLFDLEVKIVHDQYGGPNELLQLLLELIPPEIVLKVFTKYPQPEENGAFGWNGKKIVELLSPHIDKIKPLLLSNYKIKNDGELTEI